MPPRSFSIDEANSLLPQLRRLLERLRQTKLTHDSLQRDSSRVQEQLSGNGHIISANLTDARQRIASVVAELNELIEQVQATGCELKDIDQGLVDFRGERDGRQVYLCWKLGESEIGWWHDLDAGFAGRQQLE